MNTLHFAEVKSNAQQKPFLTYLVEEREWKSQMDSEPDIMLEAVDHQGPWPGVRFSGLMPER